MTKTTNTAYDILCGIMASATHCGVSAYSLGEAFKAADDAATHGYDLQELADHANARIRKRMVDEYKAAYDVLSRGLNSGNNEMIIEAMRDHPYLMNEFACASLRAIATYAPNDGRIPTHLAEFIHDRYMPLKSK